MCRSEDTVLEVVLSVFSRRVRVPLPEFEMGTSPHRPKTVSQTLSSTPTPGQTFILDGVIV